MTKPKPRYATEAALCSEFTGLVDAEIWIVLPETAGWDLLLVRKSDGVQIGIEAKLKLNSKVVEQALEGRWSILSPGPDYRAVLVPENGGSFSETICAYLGVTILRIIHYERWIDHRETEVAEIVPPLLGDRKRGRRHFGHADAWLDLCTAQRHKLPEYVPDSVAGSPCPITLTPWKIGAIKLAVLLQTRPITRADFKFFNIDHRRWLPNVGGWLQVAPDSSGWIAGPGLPDFRAQHPKTFEEIRADLEKWAPPTLPTPTPMQKSLALQGAA